MKERIVRAVAGAFVLTSMSLALFVNIKWMWLAVFVGINLFQSSFTRFCPLEKILDLRNRNRGGGQEPGSNSN